MNVYTTKGLIDSSLLRVEDEAEMAGDCRVLKTRWYLGEELVRQDVWASVLAPHEMAAQQGSV
jgi:hypothetical protein